MTDTIFVVIYVGGPMSGKQECLDKLSPKRMFPQLKDSSIFLDKQDTMCAITEHVYELTKHVMHDCTVYLYKGLYGEQEDNNI